LSTNVMKLAIN